MSIYCVKLFFTLSVSIKDGQKKMVAKKKKKKLNRSISDRLWWGLWSFFVSKCSYFIVSRYIFMSMTPQTFMLPSPYKVNLSAPSSTPPLSLLFPSYTWTGTNFITSALSTFHCFPSVWDTTFEKLQTNLNICDCERAIQAKGCPLLPGDCLTILHPCHSWEWYSSSFTMECKLLWLIHTDRTGNWYNDWWHCWL